MTKTVHESIPCFGEDGHLTELALVALADGQDFLPEASEAHLGVCEGCAERLVHLAMASADAGDALCAMAKAEARAPETAPLAAVPWRAVMAALVVSVVSVAPSLVRLPALAVHSAPGLAHAVPVLLRGILSTLSERGPSVTAATLVSSVLLVLVGVAVSRSAQHPGVSS